MMKSIILSREGSTSSSRRVLLRFKKVQLLHEIADYGYLEGEVLADEAAMSKRLLQDIVQEGNCARVVRILDLAYEKVVGLLSPLTDVSVDEEELRDDVPDRRENYDVEMSVGADFTKQRVDKLEAMIHNYMVWYALEHWLGIVNPAASGKWKEEREAVEEALKDVRFGRFAFRRPYSPF